VGQDAPYLPAWIPTSSAELSASQPTSAELHRLIVEDGLRGATFNPSIFEKAIAGSADYLYALQAID
jgi:transaldolase